MNIGHALRELRFRKGKKQLDVASAVNVSAPYLSLVETGAQQPSLDLIKSLCKLYEIPVVVLFWMALEPTDIKKSKRKAFYDLEGPMSHLINKFL